MAGKNQHVVPHPRGWAVRGAGNQCATSVHPTQGEAIDEARRIALNQESEMLVHGRNYMSTARWQGLISVFRTAGLQLYIRPVDAGYLSRWP